MHTIEPYYSWRKYYVASEDSRSPFFGRVYSEFEFSNTIYNYYIHPQWDYFGSETLYLKILFTDYQLGYCIIEFIGEWNDTLYNDVMYLKREVIDLLIKNGVSKFILIGENVMNYHSSDDSYYEEWFSDLEQGWIYAMNFLNHVMDEFKSIGVENYIRFEHDSLNWR
ncbi:MAG: hypothetical protein C0597_08830, partial [Marinilabiliales bacterium]